MNKKINILFISLCFCLMLILCTGSYKYDTEVLSKSLEMYQENNKVYHNAYKGFVAVNLITVTTNEDKTVDIPEQIKNKHPEGLYYVELETYFKYIKFYKDSSVITVSTNMPPDKVISWIDNKLENAPKGNYYISDENITFSTLQEKPEGYAVKVDYIGHKKSGKLYLNSFSQATKNHSDLIYKYFE